MKYLSIIDQVMFHTSRIHIRSSFQTKLLVLAICLLAFFLRTVHVNWDKNQHLHPDERFLTMVMEAMQLPLSVETYLDPKSSTLNPLNIGHSFFVYGTFPLIVNKVFALVLGFNSYNGLTLQGRYLSALMDTVGVLAIILIAQRFEKKYGLPRNLKYFAGLLYAVAVFPIQQSHFFTVDTFANTFFLLSFLFAAKLNKEHFLTYSALSGAMMGLAAASKINVLLAGPLVGWFLIEPFVLSWWDHRRVLRVIVSAAIVSIFWLGSFWVTLRIANPYYFDHFSLVNIQLDSTFVQNIKQLKSFADPNGFYPPGIQWISKVPILFPLVNIAVFGLGLPIFFFTVFGLGKLILFSFKDLKHRVSLLLLIAWILLFFIYQGWQFVMTMRYFLFLYPFFALCAGYGILELGKQLGKKVQFAYRNQEKVVMVIFCLCFIWPLMFMSVYIHKNSRIAASEWMYSVLPDQSMIALEHWDDPLPLNWDGANKEGKSFEGKQLPVFYEDVDEKWLEMNDILGEADYYVLTSNRGWASIMAVPEKYPRMSQFYQELFDGETEFVKVAEFTSYPSLSYLGIPVSLNDDWAEEAFTVYDHPKVMIYAKKQ